MTRKTARGILLPLFLSACLLSAPLSLSSCAGEKTGEETRAGKAVYTVRLDKPVAGFVFAFCTEDTCVPVTTSEDGAAVFEADPARYEVKILAKPVGYDAALPEGCAVGPESEEIAVTVAEAES